VAKTTGVLGRRTSKNPAFNRQQATCGRLEYFLVVSHDSFLDIQPRTEDTYQKASKTLGDFKWMEAESG